MLSRPRMQKQEEDGTGHSSSVPWRRSPRQFVSRSLEVAHKDGIIFGGNCERRVFFPTNQHNHVCKRNSAIHEDCGLLSAARRDPLSALGLLAPSPYDLLKRHAAMLELKQATRGRRMASSPEQQHKHQIQGATPSTNQAYVEVVCDGNINNNAAPPKKLLQRLQNDRAPKMLHGGGHRNTRITPPSREPTAHNATLAEVYSPSPWLQRSTTSSVYPQPSSYCCGCDEDQSLAALLGTLRADEARIIWEATRLRREADPSVLIRRFLRSSGLPLDHIFATAAWVYRRSRVQPCFSNWHATAKVESAKIRHRSAAAITIQSVVRVHSALRKVTDLRKTRGTNARNACGVIQRAFRAHVAQRAAQYRLNAMRKNAEKLARQRESERAELVKREVDACTVIQAVWRGLVGRDKGGMRARRKLQECLMDLGGGQGRMHRMHDCGVLAGCLEHVALARACEVALRASFRSRGQSHEVLALLSRCRLLLRARQELREDMGYRWAREAKAHAAAELELALRAKTDMLRQGLSRIEQTAAAAEIAKSMAWKEWGKETDRRLGELHNRQRLHIASMEQERRRRSERYLMWREETRQRVLVSQRSAALENRESRERVIMRQEDLLAKEAWVLEDSRVGYARELRAHGERIYRLFHDSLPFEARNNSSKGGPETTPLSNNVTATCAGGNTSAAHARVAIGDTAAKPEGVIMEPHPRVVDGRAVVLTVALRPSCASLLAFQQAKAVRDTRRDHDDARRQVAHWGGRCRVDAEAAVRLRREQFRLRCKTKWERRRKAEEVSNAKAVTMASIAQLGMALSCARHATVARAITLAEACRVEPPRALLGRKVANEHREKLMGREELDGYVEVQSGSAATQAAPRKGRRQLADGNCGTLHTNPSPRSELAECRSCTSNTTSTTRSKSHPTVAGVGVQHSRGAPDTAAAGKGWNREWSRSVDAWCRKTCARFRENVAEEVVRSTRRLLWLASGGSGAASIRGNRNSRGCNVGREGWAALAKFGDIPDLLELVGSTGELAISVQLKEGAVLGADKDGLNPTQKSWTPPQPKELVSPEVKDREGARSSADNAEAEVLERPGGSAKSLNDDDMGDENHGLRLPEVGDTTTSTDTNMDHLDAAVEPSRNTSPPHDVETGSDAGRKSGSTRQGRVPLTRSQIFSVTEENSDSEDEQSPNEDDHGNNHCQLDSLSVSLVDDTRAVGHKKISEGDRADKGIGLRGDCTNTAAAVTTFNSQLTRTARITLAPTTVGSALGVPPLSFFVLQVARRQAQLRPITSQLSTHGCDSTVKVGDGNSTGGELPMKGLNTKISSRIGRVRTAAVRHSKAGNGSEGGTDKKIAPGGSGEPVAGESVGLNSDTLRTSQTPLFDVEPGSGVARLLLQKEKRGLANAVETLILPHLRISSPTTNCKRAGVGKKASPLAFRLHLQLPHDRKVETRENGALGPSVDWKTKIVSPAVLEIDKHLWPDDTGAKIVDAVNATSRFLRAPLYRWVGRVEGRRCLLSCPAAQLKTSAFRFAGQRARAGRVSEDATETEESAARDDSTGIYDHAAASANTLSTASPLAAENPKTRESALLAETVLPIDSAGPKANIFRGGSGHVRRVQVIFVGGGLYTAPTPRQLQERYRVVGAQHHSIASSTVSWAVLPSEMFWEKACLGFALNNPLCSNCGHRALQRFIDAAMYLLLAQSSPSCWPETSMKLPLQHIAGEGFRHDHVDDERSQLTDSERQDDDGDGHDTTSVSGMEKNDTYTRSSRAFHNGERRRTVLGLCRRLGEEHIGGVRKKAGGSSQIGCAETARCFFAAVVCRCCDPPVRFPFVEYPVVSLHYERHDRRMVKVFNKNR